jgi:TM2 domain-containing membrane protein YozV
MIKSLTATLLSLFIPGLGQLYKSHLCWAIFWFLVVAGAYSLLGLTPLIFIPIGLHFLCLLQSFFMK